MDSYKKGDEAGDFEVPRAFICPSDIISKDKKNRLAGVLCSYGYNATEFLKQYGWFSNTSDYAINPAGNLTHKIKQAGEKLAFIDSVDWWVHWGSADYKKGWDKLGQANIYTYKAVGIHGPTLYRHNEGANIAFYDGHTAWLRKEKIYIEEDYPKNPGMWVADIALYRKYHSN